MVYSKLPLKNGG